MSKDFLAINAGRVIFTKYDPLTGALSTDPKDRRICTETIDGITRSKSIQTYDIPDGNSNYPAGTYETGVTYNVGINFTSLNTETLAFLQNATLTKAAGKIKEVIQTAIPFEAPYEIAALGTIDGTPTVLDSEGTPFTKAVAPETPTTNEYGVTVGVDPAPDKFIFNEADAGKAITIEYVFEAEEVEGYDIEENAIHPAVQIEIIHETLSVDKTKKYKNNSIVNKATLTGNVDENLARQHVATTLNFNAIKPNGTKVVRNKKTEIPL